MRVTIAGLTSLAIAIGIGRFAFTPLLPMMRNDGLMTVGDASVLTSVHFLGYWAGAILAPRITVPPQRLLLLSLLGIAMATVAMGTTASVANWSILRLLCGVLSAFTLVLVSNYFVQALGRTAGQVDYTAELLNAVESVNARQKSVLFEKISAHFDGKLQDKTIAVWGLSFKPNTDDMREAPSRTLMEALWQAGAKVRAYDPQAAEEALRIYGERNDLEICESSEEALVGADALTIVTEWKAFRSPDFEKMKTLLENPLIFDG